uniref:Uncharacterized protein n=1 Tax=Vitis vinifera TaxID=29760 RepID=F6H9W0_VITVI
MSSSYLFTALFLLLFYSIFGLLFTSEKYYGMSGVGKRNDKQHAKIGRSSNERSG